MYLDEIYPKIPLVSKIEVRMQKSFFFKFFEIFSGFPKIFGLSKFRIFFSEKNFFRSMAHWIAHEILRLPIPPEAYGNYGEVALNYQKRQFHTSYRQMTLPVVVE